MNRTPIIPSGLALCTVVVLIAAIGHAAEHPSLIVRHDDLPRLRHACGLHTATAPDDSWGKAGTHAEDYGALRTHFAKRVAGDALPGEVLSAAFLHVIAPDSSNADRQIEFVSRALLQPSWITADPLELALAMDWCFDAIAPATRREFLLAARREVEPLSPSDSPLEPRSYRRKLASLAIVLAVDEEDEPSPSWAALRERVLSAGREYVETTLPKFVEYRGASPTGPAVAGEEETLTILTIELGGQLLGRDLWPQYADSVGRWMEHYVMATTPHPALGYHFLRDDGDHASLTPAPPWEGLRAVSAHLLATRVKNPAASTIARRVQGALRGDALLAIPWRWVPIVLPVEGIPECDISKLPPARNLGSAVMMRGGEDVRTTTVWIDSAQPFLRRRQHFDAGHFLIRRGGELVVDGADDVSFEAVASKGGAQYLGSGKTPFDFEQYAVSTIAHNSIVRWDAAQAARWYGDRFLPTGGQRCIENTCENFVLSLDAQHRKTGTIRAYGVHDSAAYLVLDLAAAYDKRQITEYERAFVFCLGQALIVVDHIKLPRSHAVPTWILNLPGKPAADGAPLDKNLQIRGLDESAGVWRYDTTRWFHWREREGKLWCSIVEPSDRVVRVVGGPASVQRIPSGTHAGEPYIGGVADGFERLIFPASRPTARNAWYRLGKPTLLGPHFGKMPHWGRLEVEPTARTSEATFISVLVAADTADRDQPTLQVERQPAAWSIKLSIGQRSATLHLVGNGELGGSLTTTDENTERWDLPKTVEPDPPLPTE